MSYLQRANLYGYRSADGTFQPLRLDEDTNNLSIIDESHAQVHAGKSFTVSDTVACNTTTCKWMIITPNSAVYAHIIFSLTCTGEATFLITEGADRDAGAALDVINRRRVGVPAAATVTISRTPINGTTDGAVTLFSMRNGITGVGSKAVEGGSARETNEWILKPNTKYVISVTTYQDVHVSCKLDWYENTDLA